MSYDEDKINDSLNYIEQQQDFNQIHWQTTKSNLMLTKKATSFNQREENISQWLAEQFEEPTYQKRILNKFLVRHGNGKRKKHSFLFQFQGSGIQEKEASKPQKIIHNLSENSKVISPKKVDLKLKLPRGFQQIHNSIVTPKKASLPLIKKQSKITQMSKEEFSPNLDPIKNQTSQHFKIKLPGNETKQSYQRKKYCGTTWRKTQSFHSSTQRAAVRSLDRNPFKGCITFMK